MSPLIDVSELAARQSGPPRQRPTVLDVRWRLLGPPGRADYELGHIPGAVFVDLDHELADRTVRDQGRHPLPRPGALQAAVRRWGVDTGRCVVVYDDADGTAAARAWWLLRWAGHDDVRVLDGGWRAWLAAGRPIGTEPLDPLPGGFVVRPGSLPTLDAAGAAEVARSGVLLDARAGARYRGEQEPVDKVAGHIPGAVSAPTTDNVDVDGRWRTPGELRERFAGLGVDGTRPVGSYCGSGITAAHQLLALSVAGLDGVLYPESWSGWIGDPTRPVATGSDPG